MNPAQMLYTLQKTDLAIDQKRQRIREIDTLLANDEILLAAQQRVAEVQQQLSPLRTQQKSLEHEAHTTESKRQASEQQLYSGNMRNPKEMQDTQQEIESLQRRHSNLENTLLEVMLNIELLEANLEEAEAALTARHKERGIAHEQLLAERDELIQAIHEFTQQRQKVLTQIPPENLKIYDTMKISKRNQPVAVMDGNTCGICGVAQTVTTERAVRQGRELVCCNNCQRILVSIQE